MFERKLPEKESTKKEQTFQKGQTVIYQGEEASILDVEPVFTIKIKIKNQIVCGNNLLDDVSL